MPRALLTAVRADVIPTWRSFMSTGTIECAGRLEANFREFRFNKFQVYVRAGHSDNMAALFKVALEQAHRYEKAILCNPSIIGGEDVLAPLKAMHDVLRGAPVQAGGAVPTVNAGGTAAGTTTVAGSVSVVVGGGGGGAGAAGAAAPPPKKKSRKEMTKAERALAALSFDAPGARTHSRTLAPALAHSCGIDTNVQGWCSKSKCKTQRMCNPGLGLVRMSQN